MKIYISTKFTGLHKNTTLASLALVAENGDKFYAEFTDYDREQVANDKWFQDNIVAKLWSVSKTIEECCNESYYKIGSKEQIKKELVSWLSKFEEVQLVGDVAHYVMVLFINMFGTAFDIPSHVSPYCHDINQDIANYLNVSDKEAFDLNRECLAGICETDNKYNSLHDALIIKAIDEMHRA